MREELFREGLKAVYGDDLDGTDLAEGLQVWWKSLQKITRDYDEFQTIYTILNQNGIEQSEGTVKDWFDSVRSADALLDLPMNPDLKIGPDNTADIETISETFDLPGLAENATSIKRVIELSRGNNQSRGRKLTSWIVSEIQDDDSEIAQEVSENTAEAVQHLARQG
jgi:hypothetical protein